MQDINKCIKETDTDNVTLKKLKELGTKLTGQENVQGETVAEVIGFINDNYSGGGSSGGSSGEKIGIFLKVPTIGEYLSGGGDTEIPMVFNITMINDTYGYIVGENTTIEIWNSQKENMTVLDGMRTLATIEAFDGDTSFWNPKYLDYEISIRGIVDLEYCTYSGDWSEHKFSNMKFEGDNIKIPANINIDDISMISLKPYGIVEITKS